MLRAKSDGNLLTTFKVTGTNHLAYFLYMYVVQMMICCWRTAICVILLLHTLWACVL